MSNRDGEPVAGGDLSGLFAGAEYADNESESRNAGWGEGVGGVAGAGGGEENGYGGGRPSELIVVVGRKAGIHQVEFAFEFAEDFVVDLVFGAQMSGDGTFDVAELLGEVAVEIRLVDALTAVRCEVQFAAAVVFFQTFKGFEVLAFVFAAQTRQLGKSGFDELAAGPGFLF